MTTVSAENFSFPYEDRSFDFVLLTSVFTHLLPAAMGRYLTEVARVLAEGGRCLITYFLTNPDIYAAIGEGRARFTLPHEIADCCRVQYCEQPEKVVAYEEACVRTLYERAGLRIVEPIAYGGWSGAFQDPRHSQDFVVAERAQATE